jgi:hypothetical protein
MGLKMRLNHVFEHFLTDYALGIWILIGTVFGVMASLAKSLNAGIVPDARWWIVRILLAGFFALTAAWLSETLRFSNVGAAFLTSTFNLIGIAAVEIIERRAKRVLEGKEEL